MPNFDRGDFLKRLLDNARITRVTFGSSPDVSGRSESGEAPVGDPGASPTKVYECCSVCRGVYLLRKDGTIRHHYSLFNTARGGCVGSGKPPL